jgi:lysozyme family protein
MNYDDAFKIILGEEGGYSNDPRDPGGETKFGISKRAYPAIDVKNLTIDQAKAIYLRDYWTPVRARDLPWPLGLYMFDCAVNQGVTTAVRLLQQTLGVVVDGEFGPLTMRAARASSERDAARFLAFRARRYAGTANFDIYGTGWLTRLFVVAREGATLENPS